MYDDYRDSDRLPLLDIMTAFTFAVLLFLLGCILVVRGLTSLDIFWTFVGITLLAIGGWASKYLWSRLRQAVAYVKLRENPRALSLSGVKLAVYVLTVCAVLIAAYVLLPQSPFYPRIRTQIALVIGLGAMLFLWIYTYWKKRKAEKFRG